MGLDISNHTNKRSIYYSYTLQHIINEAILEYYAKNKIDTIYITGSGDQIELENEVELLKTVGGAKIFDSLFDGNFERYTTEEEGDETGEIVINPQQVDKRFYKHPLDILLFHSDYAGYIHKDDTKLMLPYLKEIDFNKYYMDRNTEENTKGNNEVIQAIFDGSGHIYYQ